MNNHYLQFVRELLIIATADLSGATKGQLEAWQENAMFDTGRYRRKKIRYRDEVTGKMITRDNPPIPGKQSLAKVTSIPLVSPVEFSTSSCGGLFCLLKNIIKPGCCGVTAGVFVGNIRSR